MNAKKIAAGYALAASYVDIIIDEFLIGRKFKPVSPTRQDAGFGVDLRFRVYEIDEKIIVGVTLSGVVHFSYHPVVARLENGVAVDVRHDWKPATAKDIEEAVELRRKLDNVRLPESIKEILGL